VLQTDIWVKRLSDPRSEPSRKTDGAALAR